MIDLAASGKLVLEIGAIVSLADAISLIEKLEAGESINGKAVITFD